MKKNIINNYPYLIFLKVIKLNFVNFNNLGGSFLNVTMINYLNSLKFGELQKFGEMGVLPVFSSAIENIEYITLKEAMGNDLIEITEINDSGAVPELKVLNRADVPVLILDGEELIGSKQNRIVNTTILLKEKFDTIIPVSCVEQGRWSYTSRSFHDSDRIASYKVRNVKSASVKRSIENSGGYFSDQGAVWDEVHNLQNKMEVNSPTSAMGDVYDAKTDDLDNYTAAFELLEGQRGLIVFIKGKIMGLDVISHASAYKDLHKKLIKSYALDAMVQNGDKSKSEIKIEMADNFLKNILQCYETKNRSVGYGSDHRYSSDAYIGSSLVFRDVVIHTSFFKSLEINDDIIGMARYRTRANMRQH